MHTSLRFALACLALLYTGGPALAIPEHCLNGCGFSCTVKPSKREQNACLRECLGSCEAAPDPAAVTEGMPKGRYAAAALSASQPTSSAIATGLATQELADRAALQICAAGFRKPQDCTIVLRFSRACAALAVKMDESGKVAFYSAVAGQSAMQARKNTLQACKDAKKQGCNIVATGCVH